MNSADLVQYVRELGSLPDGRFSDAEILSFADNETLQVAKDIISTRQDFLVEGTTVNLNSSGGVFRVPARALGGKVRDIVIQVQAGGVNTPGNYVAVPRVDISERYSNPIGYFYQGNQVVMWNVIPAINSAGSLVLCSYYARPGKLVPTGSAFQVTQVNGTALTGTGADPRNFTFSDVIKGTPGFESIAWGQTQAQVDGVTATTVVINPSSVFTSGSTVEVGDWISSANTSPVIQLPQEFHQVLAQRTITKCLESIGDNEGFQRAQAKAQEMQSAALDLIAERDDGQPEKLRLDVYSPWVYSNRWRWWR